MSTSSHDRMRYGNIFQNSFYIGINMSNILYGIELILYLKTIRLILSSGGVRRMSDIFYALFSTTMVFLVTVWVATHAVLGQQVWLLNAGFPGGPNAYLQKHVSDWYVDLGSTGVIVLQLMTDALMIHRCRIVWNSYRVVVIPIILWLAALVLSFLMDWTSSAPGHSLFTGISSQFALAYWTVSVFLNAIVTCMICYPILRHAKRIQEHLGREHASLYFTVTAIVAESALLYTITGIALLISFGMGSSTSVAFGPLHVLAMCISPQMLILRLIMRRTWVDDTFKLQQSSTLRFSFGDTSGTRQVDDTSRVSSRPARQGLNTTSMVNSTTA